MRKMILWVILAAFISGVALEAASPWVPVPGRKARVVQSQKNQERHARKLKKKKRKPSPQEESHDGHCAGATGGFAT